MRKKNLLYFGVLISAVAIVAAFVFVFNRNETRADLIEFWITVDQKELQTVLAGEQLAGRTLDVQISEVKNGIVVAKATNGELEKLSTAMHENYHKCAGFIAHSTEAEALKSIDETFAAKPEAQLIDYTIDNQPNVNSMIAESRELPIRQTIIDLAAFPNRRYNQTSGINSANWIKDKWTQMTASRSDISVAFFTHPNTVSPQPSIIMTVQGTTYPNEVVVLGAHQDSINQSSSTANAPGADDDASGVANLTEVIRVMVAKNFRPARTVKFMAYAAEEIGLRGSNAIAANYQTNGVNVVGVFQLDMTNYHGSTADIVLISDYTNAAQNQFIRNLVTAYQSNLTVIDNPCGYACSDHASWTNKGFVASMPYEARVTPVEDNPYIHTAQDTLDVSNNNANNALRFTKLAISYLGELAKGSMIFVDPIHNKFDYDGDGKADVSVFRPENGTWYLNQSTAGFAARAFGVNGDRVVPADYDGDGKTDLAVYRAGIWYLNRSSTGFTAVSFGNADDVPVAGDYDGDGKADIAVYRPSNSLWYVLSSVTEQYTIIAFGQPGDKPVAADYDGDGRVDIAVFRPSNATWYTSTNPATNYGAVQFGSQNDKLVPADYDGDGKTDVAVFRDGTWFIRQSGLGTVSGISFGITGDLPAPADFDGDGKTDVAVFRNGTWYLNRTTTGFTAISFGISGDAPTPNAFVQ